MRFMTKRTAIASAFALAVAGSAGIAYEAGSAFAQAAPTPTAKPAGRAGFMSALAAKLGIAPDKLEAAMQSVRKDLGMPDHRQGGPRGPMGRGPGGPPPLDAAATAIGITVDQLRTELPGKSLTDVAKAHNADPSKVKATLVAQAQTRIDDAVKAGKATADQAAKMKERAASMIDAVMTRITPAPGKGGRGGWGPKGDNGEGGRRGGPPGTPVPTPVKSGTDTPNA
jgi:hypothetical protein